LLFVMPLVLAENIHDTLTIKVIGGEYRDLNGDSINDTLTIQVDFSSSEDDFNDKTWTFDILTNITGNFTNLDFPYIVYTKNATVENIDYKDDYDTCVAAKSKIDGGWQLCQNDLVKYEGENATSYKEDLDECTFTIKDKDSDITSKNKEIEDLKEEAEDTKNAKYFWGVGGAILGILGLLFYRGELGKSQAKDKSQGEFNPTQAG